MPYLVILTVGLVFLLLGLWSRRMLMNSARNYANEAPTQSGSEMRDRSTGFALFYAWVSTAIGAALILLTIFLYVEGVFD